MILVKRSEISASNSSELSLFAELECSMKSISVMPVLFELFPGADMTTKRLEGLDFTISAALFTPSGSDIAEPPNLETIILVIQPDTS